VQNFALETVTATAAFSSDASSMEDRQHTSELQLEECKAFTSYPSSSLFGAQDPGVIFAR
jgi:hypothetical protein